MDQDVGRPERALDGVTQLVDRPGGGEIGRVGANITLVAELVRLGFERLPVAVGHHHLDPRVQQETHDGEAHAGARARHDGHPSGDA